VGITVQRGDTTAIPMTLDSGADNAAHVVAGTGTGTNASRTAQVRRPQRTLASPIMVSILFRLWPNSVVKRLPPSPSPFQLPRIRVSTPTNHQHAYPYTHPLLAKHQQDHEESRLKLSMPQSDLSADGAKDSQRLSLLTLLPSVELTELAVNDLAMSDTFREMLEMRTEAGSADGSVTTT
jgi:hypothetical protein